MNKTKFNKDKIKIAIIGCGRISRNHIKSIFIHKNQCELVAICDNNVQRLFDTQNQIQELLNQFSIQISPIKEYKSDKDFFDNIKNKNLDLDLIVLTTPSGLHPKHTIMGAELGINICTEKPMATNWADGLKMVDTCNKNNVKLFVVKQNRFNKTISLVKC